MKYTENSVQDLKQIGFEVSYHHKDQEINYTVMKNGFVEVTICHTERHIYFDVNTDDSCIPVQSILSLKSLTYMVNYDPKKNTQTDSN